MDKLKKLLYILVLLICPVSCISKTDVCQLRYCNALKDLALLEAWQEPIVIEKPLNLYDVVEIAMANNLEVYAQEYEREAQSRFSNAQHLKMLPALSLDATWNYRSRPTFSFQKTIFPDRIDPPPPSGEAFPITSSIQTVTQADVRGTIRFIDMALAYFTARQEKNKALILQQQHIRVRQKMILDIADAYWKAIAAKNAIVEMEKLVKLSEAFQLSIRENVRRKYLSVMQGLDIEARLVDQQIRLEAIRYQYQTSKLTLADMMGLLPGTCFELEEAELPLNEIELCDLRPLEEEALFSRPELAVKDLEEKVAIEKIREAIIPMFPDLSLFDDYNYDGNPFFVYNYWWSIGIRATWNLLSIAQQWQLKRAAEDQKQLARMSRMALSISVMTQVHIGYLNYRDLLHQYKLALKGFKIRNELAEAAVLVRQAGEFQGIDVLNIQTDALIAKIGAWKAYASMQLAREQLNYAIGKPLKIIGEE